ncbi:MAG: hypothetical protein ABL927_01210 [Bdellovibrionales bacterium]
MKLKYKGTKVMTSAAAKFNRVIIFGLLLIGASFLIGRTIMAQDNFELPQAPEQVSVPLENAYIPGGFDSNDRAQVVVEGHFPNTCYRQGPYTKILDAKSNELSINQTAFKYKGMCLMMLVPFTETVQVGIMGANNYKVKDAISQKELGTLPVSLAKNSGPDDHLYASVSDAYVGVIDGSDRVIILQGEFPGDCWRLKEKKVIQDGKNVLVVLPIIEKFRNDKCNDVRIPFISTAALPTVNAGRFLLHVRSLNGAAINKLVDL